MLLIVHRSERQARPLADMLCYMGLLAYHVKPSEALSEISTRYRAVLILHPQTLPDAEDFLRRLRSYAADIPFFAVTAAPTVCKCAHLFTHVFEEQTTAAHMAEDMILRCIELRKEPPGVYRLGGIDASVDLVECRYFNRPLDFTPTEARILRFLIRAFPTRVSAQDMLRYVFSPAKRPQLSGIRTHISSMNRKFRALNEGRVLIDLAPRAGYRILTPIRDEKELLFL